MSHQSGLGIVWVFFAIAVLGAMVTALVKRAGDGSRFGRKLDTSMSLAAVQSQFEGVTSCQKTLESVPASCLGGGGQPYIDLLDAAGNVVVPKGGRKFGEFTLRARCNPAIGGIEVRAAKLVEGADSRALNFDAKERSSFKRDEVNAQLSYDWRHPKGLLFGHDPAIAERQNNSLCREFFDGSASSGMDLCKGADQAVLALDSKSLKPQCIPIGSRFSVASCEKPGHFVVAIRNGVAECKEM